MGKKILITGSNGLLGQKLIGLIGPNDNFDLYATARGENRVLEQSGFTYHTMDITSADSVNAVFDEVKPDLVIHGAAMTNVDACETEREQCKAINIDGVQHIVDACEAQGSYLCFVSTDFIFDGTEGPYLEEGNTPNPVSYYGESKLIGEQIVKNSKLKWSIARTILVYGITEGLSRSNIILWIKGSLESGKEINVVNDQWRSPTLAEDLAAGCFLLAQKEETGVFNISGKEVLTPYEMALRTADLLDLDKSLIHETDGSKFKQTAKRPPKTGFIIDKAINQLGYAPHSFEEGIQLMMSQIAEIERK